MKTTSLTRSLLASCSVVALTAVLYGCSSSSDNSALDNANEQVAGLTEQLETANGEVARLMTEIEGDGTEANPGLTARLDTATGEVTRLTGELGMAAADVTRLTGELGMAAADVTRLTTLIDGDGTDANPGLTAELAAANGEVTRLTGELGTEAAEVIRLTGELGTEAAEVARLTTLIDGDGTDANPGLTAELAAAQLRIAALEAGTDEGQLTPIQVAAKTASDAAATAETAAGTAADEADAAMANRATIQTGMANSITDAYDARAAAKTAMEEAAKALAAYDAATTAPNAGAATAEQVKAEAAQTAAEDAQGDAEDARDEAVADADAELKIADTVKSVGDTMIDAEASSSVITTDGETVNTGLQPNGEHPMTTVIASPGVSGVAGDPTQTDNPYVAPVARAAGKTFPIGKLVDSADDLARLMIVTSYAGTRTVKVYASDGVTVPARDSTRANAVELVADTNTNDDMDDTVYANLKSVGTYYRAGTATTIPTSPTGEMVAADAKGVHVYRYVDDQDPNNEMTFYVVRNGTSTDADGGITYHYAAAEIHVEVDRDGDTQTNNDHEVTAEIPEATDYQHIHFGVWAALGDAEKDGTQEIDDLGIGFVQNYSDSGMTGADMPNNGDATYTGSWVATVQEADEDGNGDITLTNGDASIAADFGDGDITATLDELATLTGDIAGNQFSGIEATATGGGLDTTADFEGSFSGAFYGSKAAEAGGVFDFASEDNEGGAFRGALGGKRD